MAIAHLRFEAVHPIEDDTGLNDQDTDSQQTLLEISVGGGWRRAAVGQTLTITVTVNVVWKRAFAGGNRLVDHPVGLQQQFFRDREPERTGGLTIDDQFKACRLLHG